MTLQDQLGTTWLTLGVDDFIRALPGGDKPTGAQASIDFHADGSISVDDDFRHTEAAWYHGLAAIARSGTGLIIDEVFLGGRASQERLAKPYPALPCCGLESAAIPTLPLHANASDPIRSWEWPGCKRSTSTTESYTTSSWTPRVQPPKNVHASSSRTWLARDNSTSSATRAGSSLPVALWRVLQTGFPEHLERGSHRDRRPCNGRSPASPCRSRSNAFRAEAGPPPHRRVAREATPSGQKQAHAP
jgi:chloramphenicol phosphotransferase-like protein